MIGKELPLVEVPIERNQLRLFAKATGETDPIYTDRDASLSAGFSDIVAPPTFLFGLNLAEHDEAIPMLEALGGSLERALHGMQDFRYHQLAFAGDVIRFEGTISDIYEKAGGRLEFFETATRVTNQNGAHIADMRMTIAVRCG